MQESYQSYVKFYDQKTRKEEIFKNFATILSATATLVFGLYQSLFGIISGNTFGDIIAGILAVLLIGHISCLVVSTKKYPEFLYGKIQKITEPLATAISSVAIAILFLIFFPISALQNKKLQKNHPSTYYWLANKIEMSSWRPKKTYLLHRQKNSGLATLWYFVTNKNYFLLIVAILLIGIATVMLLSASPIISPFIYPIF